MGVPGPDAGDGGKHLLLPPDWDGQVPDGYYVARSTTYRVLAGVRSLPVGGDVPAANDRILTVKVHPLDPPARLDRADLAGPQRPATTDHAGAVGDPFGPDERMTRILEQAARIANGQLRVQSFADRRPDRVVWPGRQWQWAALRFEDGDFYAADHLDVDAREKWFFQAIGASPAMFRRAGAGSLYWLGLRDADGAYLDGARTYRLAVPQPVPGKLFWSITVYDGLTRSQIRTDQNQAALRSLFELADTGPDATAELWFGPVAPRERSAAGSRPFPAGAGSCTSASTGPGNRPSTAPGSSPTSRAWSEDPLGGAGRPRTFDRAIMSRFLAVCGVPSNGTQTGQVGWTVQPVRSRRAE
jgi:hypothetical protein